MTLDYKIANNKSLMLKKYCHNYMIVVYQYKNKSIESGYGGKPRIKNLF